MALAKALSELFHALLNQLLKTNLNVELSFVARAKLALNAYSGKTTEHTTCEWQIR